MLSQAESEKREIDAQLKMLQKQIEPHFLHNTLANAGSLISSDPVLAKRLLERLKDWQSVALAPARSDSTTLDDEMNMLENYLQILKLRFGDRLHWRIDAPEDAHVSPFPPLLLQPLFENAVRQGAELNRDGGGVVIRANVTQDKLRIELNGSGAGLHDKKGSRRAGQSAGAAGKLVRRAGRLMPGKHADGVSTATLDLPIMKLSS